MDPVTSPQVSPRGRVPLWWATACAGVTLSSQLIPPRGADLLLLLPDNVSLKSIGFWICVKVYYNIFSSIIFELVKLM